jgi:hypothetical protein
VSRGALWTGRVLTALGVLFLLFDAVIKVVGHPSVATASIELGMPATLAFKLGVLELILLGLYLMPRTALLGAVLWTGYLGGAIFAQVRIEAPVYSHILFPTYIAALLWGGLYLRRPALGTLLPLLPQN